MLSIHSSPIGKLGTKDTGGMSVYIRELAHELGRCGHRVDIFTLLRSGDQRPVIHLNDNVRLIHLRIQHKGNISKQAIYNYVSPILNSLENFRINENLDYDIIHSHYWLSGLLGNRLQDIWERPHLVMFHTLGAVKNSTGVGKPEPELRIAVEKRIMKTCHRILVPTEGERKKLLSFYPVASGKIGIIPCGVNLKRFSPIEKMTARKALGFQPDDKILLYVGRFDPLKGLNRLLQAIVYLNNHHHRLRLMIIGGDGIDAREHRHLLQNAVKLGIDDKVVLTGRIEQNQLPPYYGSADALVIPSYYESFGLVGLEALACGRPVVSTPVGAMENIICQDQTGQVVNNPSPKTIARSIESVISDSRFAPADKIRESVLGYSWSAVASAIGKEYKNLLTLPTVSKDMFFSAGAVIN
jgi:D-inositol-3-phosphate glycosyltransferase